MTPFTALEQSLVDQIKTGPVETVNIVKSLRDSASAQTVYRAINSLLTKGVIVKKGTEIAISLFWLHGTQLELSAISAAYKKLKKQNTKSTTYTFKNHRDFDSFWNHEALRLYTTSSNKRPCIFWQTSSYWWYIANHDVKVFFHKLLALGYVPMVGVADPWNFDQKFISYIRSIGGQVARVPSMPQKNTMMQVFDDYCIVLTFPDKFILLAEDLIRSKNAGKMVDIDALLNYKGNFKLKIMYSPSAANKVYRVFKKRLIFPNAGNLQ